MTATRTFDQVCDELDLRRHVTLGLDRTRELLSLLDHPEKSLRVVQVVGTNGKGTTAVAISAALEEAGFLAGTYLSPHVLSYTERMMLGRSYVSEERFASVMGRVMEAADREKIPASQFELLTAGALQLFREEGVTWAVLEAGLGARYDATTAAGAEAVVLTNVGFDHAEYLGNTLEEIAHEKLSSLPRDGVLVLGDENPVIVDISRKESEKAGARLVETISDPAETGEPETGEPETGEPETGEPETGEPETGVSFVRRNVSLGLQAAEELLGYPLGTQARERVFQSTSGLLPGRFEVHEVGGVPVVVDGGHNPGGLEAVLEAVREAYGEKPLGVVFGVLRDKDIGSMLTALKNKASYLVLTRPDTERAADPGWISGRYDPRDSGGKRAEVVSNVEEALDQVVREMKKTNGVVLVTGSLYTGVPILRWLREN